MRPVLLVLVASMFVAGAAMAQYSTTTTVTTVGTVASTGQVCPPTMALPQPCPAIAAPSVSGDMVVLVLGTEERYALDNLNVRRLNWRNTALNYQSIFAHGNPLEYHFPNQIVARHGNPYFPYYQLSPGVTVSGRIERFERFPSSVSSTDRQNLEAVTTQYRTLTPQQAMALGYQPLGACINGVGAVYINQALIDNQFNAMQPEAFVFSPSGQLLAVNYLVTSSQPVSLFGQPLQASSLAPGAQQLTVWLFQTNRNGMFSLTNPSVACQ